MPSSLDCSLVRDKRVLCSHDSVLQVTFYLREKMVKKLVFKNKSEGDTFVWSLNKSKAVKQTTKGFAVSLCLSIK